MFSEIFRYKSVNVKKPGEFGFAKSGKDYIFARDILDGEFLLKVVVSGDKVLTQVFDKNSGDEYLLYNMPDAQGEFVGQVRAEVEKTLHEICDKCFESDVFKSKQAKEIIDFVSKNFGDKLEFLWEKSPNIAILRRKDNKKWYAVLFVMAKNRLKVDSDEVVDIIDLRIQPDRLQDLVDNKSIFVGYHMNKKHWVTICLDGSVKTQDVLNFVENSYNLAKK